MNIPLADICSLVSLTLGLKEVKGNDRILEDLGAQSLDVIKIATAVERKYDVFLEDSLLPEIKTIDDLHRKVKELSEE